MTCVLFAREFCSKNIEKIRENYKMNFKKMKNICDLVGPLFYGDLMENLWYNSRKSDKEEIHRIIAF